MYMGKPYCNKYLNISHYKGRFTQGSVTLHSGQAFCYLVSYDKFVLVSINDISDTISFILFLCFPFYSLYNCKLPLFFVLYIHQLNMSSSYAFMCLLRLEIWKEKKNDTISNQNHNIVFQIFALLLLSSTIYIFNIVKLPIACEQSIILSQIADIERLCSLSFHIFHRKSFKFHLLHEISEHVFLVFLIKK